MPHVVGKPGTAIRSCNNTYRKTFPKQWILRPNNFDEIGLYEYAENEKKCEKFYLHAGAYCMWQKL